LPFLPPLNYITDTSEVNTMSDGANSDKPYKSRIEIAKGIFVKISTNKMPTIIFWFIRFIKIR